MVGNSVVGRGRTARTGTRANKTIISIISQHSESLLLQNENTFTHNVLSKHQHLNIHVFKISHVIISQREVLLTRREKYVQTQKFYNTFDGHTANKIF